MPDLLDEIRESNRLLAEQIRLQKDWRLSLRNGLLAGLGGFLGATIVAALVVASLKPILEWAGLSDYEVVMKQKLGR